MSETHTGAATFKKVHGMIRIDEDASPATLVWRSTDGDKSTTVLLNMVDKLQATPANSDKMMLRIVGKIDPNMKKRKDNEGNEIPVKAPVYMFTFNNRTVMDNIKETLQHIIARYKDEEATEERHKNEPETEAQDNPAASVTPQPAHLPQDLINTTTLDTSLTKSKLLSNLKLQQSLLKESRELMTIFQDTVIKSGLPPHEFWSTRIPLLRAYALSTSQKTGPYNVLSTIKPVASSDNKVNVNVSREKIHTIFQNYPIVRKAFDDNVPKNFKEQEFWARFFSSKLFRKLRGERIMNHDRGDMIIDRYLSLDQEYDRRDDELLQHPVRKIIDIEGNINDDPVKKGHRPDFTMRSGIDPNGNSDGGMAILKGMNRLSEKMVESLENEYSRANLPQEDPDKEEREEILFSDLDEDTPTDYAEIKLKRKVLDAKNRQMHKENSAISWEEVKHEINSITSILDTSILDLTTLTHITADVTKTINQRIMKAVKVNAKQSKHMNGDTLLGSTMSGTSMFQEAKESASHLPPGILESCRLLNSSCCEFLKHFYINFQSGDPRKTNLVKKLYKSLMDCQEKIDSLLNSVDTEENQEIAKYCKAYLVHVLDSVGLGINKYRALVKGTAA
ncbi:RNA polymerase II transcription factor B subunit 1 [Kluyveromyces marxianus]|uniref:RNA polymerase II transcription factor B subunit 1 n=1 Tax=Kluyveromyces marxianus TaxID=4911 RepID=A0ABX6EVA2_KLUMA|nr:RNA polymerase II transcription factor B subunit 1 [Kluyveromyces marxianus]